MYYSKYHIIYIKLNWYFCDLRLKLFASLVSKFSHLSHLNWNFMTTEKVCRHSILGINYKWRALRRVKEILWYFGRVVLLYFLLCSIVCNFFGNLFVTLTLWTYYGLSHSLFRNWTGMVALIWIWCRFAIFNLKSKIFVERQDRVEATRGTMTFGLPLHK